MTVTWPKIEIFKIQDGGGRHLENCFFGRNSSTNCPILAKFCMRKQNGMSTRATRQKLQIFLNTRWRTAAILKIVKSPYVGEELSIFDEIQYTYSKWWTRSLSCEQKLKFLKFKMAATAILKIALVAITHRPIFRFRRNFVWRSRMACRQRSQYRNCKFLKSKMADGCYFENL